MSQCARPGCVQSGKHGCSACFIEAYCSGECQKADWKAHKLICKTLKQLPKKLQPYNDVVRTIHGILKAPEKIGSNVRVLNHVLSYALLQFGDRVEGKTYRERRNGDQISNWGVEIATLQLIHYRVISIYRCDQSLSTNIGDNMMIPHLEKVHQLLMPWTILIDPNDTSLTDVLNKEQTSLVLELLSTNGRDIAVVYTNRTEFNLAENHCQRALTSSKRYEGESEKKTELMNEALIAYGNLRLMERNYTDAAIFHEEAYDCVAVAYNPVHPMVQTAAGNLIECLIHKGDLYDAERYAQVTLDSLKDPANGLDQDSDDVARGYYNLANVINMQDGDLVKAERLARESHRISIRTHGANHYFVGATTCLLAINLKLEGKMGDETKKLYESSLAISIKNEGLDGNNAAVGNANQLLSGSSTRTGGC
jgi:tetratricopeptide (TPR) repeat protein